MINTILLDTNAFKHMFEKTDSNLLELINSTPTIYLSTIVLGELFAGYKLGSKEKENKRILHKFTYSSFIEIIPVSQKTAELYADIMLHLTRKGKPAPTNDMWIAAHAIETESVLVTYDKHFLHIDGLKIWN